MPDSRQGPIRTQDLVWLLLFPALALASPDRNPYKLAFLGLLAALQLSEARVAYLGTARGNLIAILLKLVLGFLVIGFSDGIRSSYYLIQLLPVISAATTLGVGGTLVVTALACGSYMLFAHPFFLTDRFVIDAEGYRELSLRMIFFPVVGFLAYQLAEENRLAAQQNQATADQLAEANRNLQEAEAAMRRSERLAALGQMSAGLAHELRNPLGTVKASAEMLARSVPAGDGVARELTGFISSEVDRVNSLITKFLDFARPLKLHLEAQPLDGALDRAVDQIQRHQPPFPVTIYKNYSPDIPPFRMDGELMERVAYNLLLNAVQASPPGSAVTLKTRVVDGLVEIAVIDRGSGVDAAHRENIFNPFFTTKREGVGLGLAICAKVVDEHGGKITVESEPGAGSVFRVLLPLEPPESTA
ncbi:MAG: ATP-binding protein [Bryobacteraceae bacterium]|nr:ATP-binding protein [Bryobacteraceae bacterium]